jgi:hypothetical protein
MANSTRPICGAPKMRAFMLVLTASVVILWSTYAFRYYESQPLDRFNRPMAQKIADVRSPAWRTGLAVASQWHLLPRSYVWGLADIVRTGMEGRAYSTYAFGRLTFMEWRPFIFPGYILARLPVPLLLLSVLGAVLAFADNTSPVDKVALAIFVALGMLLLLILANSAADYAGVRHALTVYIVLALLTGIAVRSLLMWRRKFLGLGTLALIVAACVPALAGERPWEYHNFIGGTRNAYATFEMTALISANVTGILPNIVIVNWNQSEKCPTSSTTNLCLSPIWWVIGISTLRLWTTPSVTISLL